MAWSSTVGHGGTTDIGDITLDKSTLNVAIFLPDLFHASPGIDLIVYYHGHTTRYGANDVKALLDYTKNKPIRAAVGKHGRYALVVPWLGTKPNRLSLYKTITASDGSLAAFLSAIVAEIAARSNIPGPVDPANCLRPSSSRRIRRRHGPQRDDRAQGRAARQGRLGLVPGWILRR